MILKQKGIKEAKEYLKWQFTTPKNRNKLISIEKEENNNYWSISFKN